MKSTTKIVMAKPEHVRVRIFWGSSELKYGFWGFEVGYEVWSWVSAQRSGIYGKVQKVRSSILIETNRFLKFKVRILRVRKIWVPPHNNKYHTCWAFSWSSSKMIWDMVGSFWKKWKNKSISTSENLALEKKFKLSTSIWRFFLKIIFKNYFLRFSLNSS